MTQPRYDAGSLTLFATGLLVAAGMEQPKAEAMAEILVDTDMLGHNTHGLALLPMYLREIGNGSLTCSGTPEVLSDRAACLTWNGRGLPGFWLLKEAIAIACERSDTFGMSAVAIGNAHHMGCLASFLEPVTAQGKVILIFSSAPSSASVAPFGGRSGALSPAPVAVGIPTAGDPIIIDTSASITTNNMAQRMTTEGRVYDSPAFVGADGSASGDPAVLAAGGAILPAGGMDHGQKGYGWNLITETTSQGFSGQGRSGRPRGIVNAALVQVMEPGFFAGTAAFGAETSAIVAACHAATPVDPARPTRVPGESGLGRKRAALADGVALRGGIMENLEEWATRFDVALPAAL
ncbi:Ldh family oxidoreductase [Salipiger sp.]|uniref:Ldh family oxidoreductase n=1 Tax=Salipiger sp. TaxID=2078585 RepID=UPI003A982878